jgi:tRNA dimethylallyltransferase
MSEQPSAAKPPVVVVTGPTSAGKTSLAIDLALRFDAEIVNADSMQVYRFMDIGTAKPTLEQRARAPHHLLDVVTPDAWYSAGRYADAARAAAAQIHARGKLVLLVGGTGLYIRAFLEGLLHGAEADPELRAELEG